MNPSSNSDSASSSPDPKPVRKRRPYVPAVGPRLRRLLWAVLILFALLGFNSLYLSSITFLEWWNQATYQNYFYQLMFLGHLVLGLAIVLPVVIFGLIHMKIAHDRPNRRAVRVGYALLIGSLLLLITGLVLMRLDGFELRDPRLREVAYWMHVSLPILVVWLYILHRLAGPRIKWKWGGSWALAAGAFALLMAGMHSQDPRVWNQSGPESGEQYFFPSLARTATGDFIPARALQNDAYCRQCHETAHDEWSVSAHRFSSFNNPAYLASVRETRLVGMERDGNVQASRFCAGCHDPAPFFSGAFDDPDFDDQNHPTAKAGITCSSCHSITHLNSARGNADYTIEEPAHYPFAYSDQPVLQWINRQLVKAKPAFHKKTFLKPLHQSADFCGACHKVHLPEELNGYKWLRGQNHFDSYRLSGVSGHGAASFYYPPKAEHNCNSCHMPLALSNDFGANDFDGSGELKIHNHMFPSANTAIPALLGFSEEVNEAHAKFNEGVVRLDFFGVRKQGQIDGELLGPLRPEVPVLEPGENYLVDLVLRTLKMGHAFTQGTSDSNEVWIEVALYCGDELIGKSGGQAEEGDVDPWSHFVNSFVLDKDGMRIDRRNAQDIFVPLYSHQIPPGAADVLHYRFQVPENPTGPIEVRARWLYRKFDTAYARMFQGDEFDGNDLPIMTLAEERLVLPVLGVESQPNQTAQESSSIELWQRWNDYGIGLFRKGNSGANQGELRQAEAAFAKVEALGRPDGPLNLARVYLKEGRVDEAALALDRARLASPPAPDWSLLWFGGLVNKQNGYLDEAIDSFRQLIALDTEATRAREFDFSQDWRVLAELGQTLVERSRAARGEARQAEREGYLREALGLFEQVLELDPEDLSAHYNLALIYEELQVPDSAERASFHRSQHERYRPDDNARDLAVSAARRRYPAADKAANPVVIYDLQRPDAYPLPE